MGDDKREKKERKANFQGQLALDIRMKPNTLHIFDEQIKPSGLNCLYTLSLLKSVVLLRINTQRGI